MIGRSGNLAIKQVKGDPARIFLVAIYRIRPRRIMPESPPAKEEGEAPSGLTRSSVGPERQFSKLTGSPFPVLGILLVGSCGGFLAGRYNQSFLWIVILLFLSYFILKRRLERLRIYHRHAVEREATRQRLDRHVESTEWLNFVMERLWTVLEPTLSVQITEKLNSLMETNRPSFLDSLELTELTLGSSPPLITGARVHPQTDPEIIVSNTTSVAGRCMLTAACSTWTPIFALYPMKATRSRPAAGQRAPSGTPRLC